MKKYLFVYLLSSTILFSCKSVINFSDNGNTPVVTANSDLLISEISTAINTDPAAAGSVSGGRNHYVEIYNGTGAAVDLSNYAIGYQATTDVSTLSAWTFPATNYFILKGTLAAGKCYVIASPQVSATFVKYDTTWGTTSTTAANSSNPLQLSGNSAVALLKKDAAGSYSLTGTTTAAYKIIDVFGSPLVARVTSTGATSSRNNLIWATAGEVADTRNRTFWRKSTVKTRQQIGLLLQVQLQQMLNGHYRATGPGIIAILVCLHLNECFTPYNPNNRKGLCISRDLFYSRYSIRQHRF